MLAAAAQAIGENGYGSFTVAQVIARAKVSRKTFYDAFEDREDCFIGLLEALVAEVGARMSAAYRRESSWRESVTAGLTELLEFIDEEPLLARVCVVDALGGGRRVLERRAEVLAKLGEAIDRGRGAGGRSEPAGVAAEGVLGGVFAVIHIRLLERDSEPFTGLLGSLMSMIVLPYLGPGAASRELARASRQPPGARDGRSGGIGGDPLDGVSMRLTYRTARVLTAVRQRPGASNRQIAESAQVADPGQMSRLMARLERLRLVENTGDGRAKGGSNEWRLTERGERVERATRPSSA